MRQLFICFLVVCFVSFSANAQEKKENLVQSNKWFIAGPSKESEETINDVRLKKGIITITAKDNPKGEIELNVMITSSETNDGIPTNLSNESKFVEITYQSTQIIKLQAREGNSEGTGCVHGGSHPRISLPASPNQFKTIKIPWSNFKQDELADGKLLNIHNLCKFNFVNYNPVSGSVLKIKSVIID
ncbi:hypothetical protein HNP37_001468 [Flavobacterium nitrogenifigens]|uniref:YceI-like domain-containing protein n=2 Tax=Flavobacterium TaxID=237 RepID=A0A7W7N7K1_9FLAO|nr:MULTISPECIES: hypothetical protein [Flavobacterium]MBB4801407.1 hypothetical protein [Flavobacterium nitrogenifigens]MBB6386364.1 hypothetical protein [Flavobacterium notoginsengisoli]